MAAYSFPPMPELGHTEEYYRQRASQAEKAHDVHAREAAKVGQYVTLGIQDDCTPDRRMKYFRHAIRRHCVAPPGSDETVDAFYDRLRNFVRAHAGQEAFRIASIEDDRFAMRLRHGESRIKLVYEAKEFFQKLMGPQEWCPEIFIEEDWQQLMLIRRQWQEEDSGAAG